MFTRNEIDNEPEKTKLDRISKIASIAIGGAICDLGEPIDDKYEYIIIIQPKNRNLYSLIGTIPMDSLPNVLRHLLTYICPQYVSSSSSSPGRKH